MTARTTPLGRRAARRAAALAAFVAAGAAGAAAAPAFDDGTTQHFPAVQASAAAPLRQALIVAPGPSSPGPFGADAVADRDLLRLLGFDVTMVTADTRPRLDSAIRDFADAVKRDAEVAIFVLGSSRAGDGALFLTPTAARPSPSPPAAADFDGIRLARLLHAITRRAPKETVVVVDGCVPGDLPACPSGPDVVPRGVSAVLAGPVHPSAAPPASLGRALLGLMKRDGLTFADLAEPLRQAAGDAGLGFAATPAPSRTFAFLPADLLARLPRPCNDVDPRRGAEALRDGPSLAPLVADCAAAAVTYSPWPYFRDRLAVAREQRSAQTALAACDEAAAATYLGAYPGGRYRAAVVEQRRTCAPPPPPPTSPPPPPAPLSPLEQRATAAVADYYRRHDYHDGDSFAGLASLYPPTFRDRDRTVTGREHLGKLGEYYGSLSSVQINVIPGSLDLGGCVKAESCRVRGRIRSQTLKKGQSDSDRTESRFSLVFDLDTSKVLYECAVAEPANPRERPCE